MAGKLRQDITGLRAIAVLSVTLYHLVHVFFPSQDLFRGGFLGVDIFFVISGFLMTGIIIRGLDNNNFSLTDFYKRRAVRICPALLVTVAFFTALGFLLFSTGDLKRMCFEGAYALLFVSNQYFAAKTDYFANSALDQVFLHTWSLSAEWQFYLFYPLLLILLKKILKDNAKIASAVLLITVISFVFSVYFTAVNPKASYYILPSRAFELLAGALAFFYDLSYLKRKFSVLSFMTPFKGEALGLVVIAVSMCFITERNGWPSAYALPPIFGAWLCIAAANEHSLLRNVFFQKLGIWSYAVYLVHWPILVFVTKLGFYAFSFEILIPILLFGIALHYAAERRRSYGVKTLVSYAAVFVLCYSAALFGTSFRLEHEVSKYAQYGGHSVPFEGEIDHIGDISRAPDFILAGDSFARHYTLDLKDRGLHTVTVFRDGCYSLADHVNRRSEGYVDEKCRNRYDNFKKALHKYAGSSLPVVVAQDWPRYASSLTDRKTGSMISEDDFASALKQDLKALSVDGAGFDIYVLGTPRQPVYDVGSTCMYLHALENPLSRFMRRHFTCIQKRHLDETPLNDLIRKETEKYDNLHYIDPNEAVCDGDLCDVVVAGYIPVFQDGLHYSWAGSVRVVSHILQQAGIGQGRVRHVIEDAKSADEPGVEGKFLD